MGHFHLVIISLFFFFEKSEKQIGHFYLLGVFSLFEIRKKVRLGGKHNSLTLLIQKYNFPCSDDFREKYCKTQVVECFPIKRSGGLLCLTMFAVKLARDSVERN